MCCDNCEHFRFNPQTGDGRCISKAPNCPGEDEKEYCEDLPAGEQHAWCEND